MKFDCYDGFEYYEKYGHTSDGFINDYMTHTIKNNRFNNYYLSNFSYIYHTLVLNRILWSDDGKSLRLHEEFNMMKMRLQI